MPLGLGRSLASFFSSLEASPAFPGAVRTPPSSAIRASAASDDAGLARLVRFHILRSIDPGRLQVVKGEIEREDEW